MDPARFTGTRLAPWSESKFASGMDFRCKSPEGEIKVLKLYLSMLPKPRYCTETWTNQQKQEHCVSGRLLFTVTYTNI